MALPGAQGHNAAMDDTPAPSALKTPAQRLAALRAEVAERGLAGFIVPLADEHQNEWVPAHAQRLAWLTGFTGSAGFAVVLAGSAAIFVDGRYTLQSREQVDETLYTIRHMTDEPAADWIAANLGGGALGYDPWLATPGEVARYKAACEKAGGSLVPCPDNPLDAVWADRPARPAAPMVPHDLAFAGEPAAEKRGRLGATLATDGIDAAVLTAPDSIAWLLNVRGGDLEFTPVALAFAILRADASAELFVDSGKTTPALIAHLGNAVSIAPTESFAPALDALGADDAKVTVDPASAAAFVFERLEAAGASPVRRADPCAMPKACKNDTELAGIRSAHVRDGVALTNFLGWLNEVAADGALDEWGAAEHLEGLRRRGEHFQRLSFPTIAGAGLHGAIVHYRVTEESNRRLQPGELFLVDSGAQYLDGTTDVTRTVAIGAPGEEERERFTLVLKGHIALATCRFPKETTGSQLDVLARHALWQAGLDYDHGTGHGVGTYLNVHEGPQRISKIPNRAALRPGMIVSNEPGYYKEGAYGIRIENLVAVREADAPEGADRPLYEFETLTLAPIDRTLIDTTLLNEAECGWIDRYHERVRETLTPLVEAATATWLAGATTPVGEGEVRS